MNKLTDKCELVRVEVNRNNYTFQRIKLQFTISIVIFIFHLDRRTNSMTFSGILEIQSNGKTKYNRCINSRIHLLENFASHYNSHCTHHFLDIIQFRSSIHQESGGLTEHLIPGLSKLDKVIHPILYHDRRWIASLCDILASSGTVSNGHLRRKSGGTYYG